MKYHIWRETEGGREPAGVYRGPDPDAFLAKQPQEDGARYAAEPVVTDEALGGEA